MRNTLKKIGVVLVIICIAIGIVNVIKVTKSGLYYTRYNCNELEDNLEIRKNAQKWARIDKNNSLTLYDVEGEKKAEIGDSRVINTEFSNGIYLDGKFRYDIEVLFDLYGEIIKLYDGEEMIAMFTFEEGEYKGALYDKDGKIMAIYEPRYQTDEYIIRIKNNSKIQHEVIVTAFSLYYMNYQLYNN